LAKKTSGRANPAPADRPTAKQTTDDVSVSTRKKMGDGLKNKQKQNVLLVKIAC
jgi:hypothetical protein